MSKKLLFLLKITLLVLSANSLVFAEVIQIVPIKKPKLIEEVKEKKITQNIIKPAPKPKKKILEKKIITKKEILPTSKPKNEKIETEKRIDKETQKIVKKEEKIKLLLPKSKPLTVKKEVKKIETKSKYYNKKDFALAKKSITAMEKKQWSSALTLAKKAKDKSVYNFIQWRHLLTKGNQASFYDYQIFINKNESYPRIGRIKYLAEHKLSTDKISPKKIIDWFGASEPLSGYGKLILGESLIKSGNVNLGKELIKAGWITAELSRSDMKFFRKKYKKYLDSKDYINRADYLAWENKYWDLKRMLRYLPKDYELLYTARQILMSKSYGVDNAIKNVPAKLKNDSGLNYDRLKWRRKRGRTDSALEILLKIKNNKEYLVRPDKWWVERSIITRSLIYKKKI